MVLSKSLSRFRWFAHRTEQCQANSGNVFGKVRNMAIVKSRVLRQSEFVVLIFIVLTLFCSDALAGEETISIGNLKQGLDTVWVLLAAFLVFFMQAGFGMVESGFIRAKNTCNILTKNFLDFTKNFLDFCMASLGFFLIGYALMFGDGNGGYCCHGNTLEKIR